MMTTNKPNNQYLQVIGTYLILTMIFTFLPESLMAQGVVGGLKLPLLSDLFRSSLALSATIQTKSCDWFI